jgi:hypothetical protein
MKKTLGTLWSSFRYHFLQVILLFVAFFSWLEASILGERFEEISKTGNLINRGAPPYVQQDVAVAITSGFTGGAIAMGLITSVCIFGVVWLEINKSKP